MSLSGSSKLSGSAIPDENSAFTPASNKKSTNKEPTLNDILAKPDNLFPSGSTFDPLIHQPRRDMYGGDLNKGIPIGFQNILYELSHAVIKQNIYGKPAGQGTTKRQKRRVFANKKMIYEFIDKHLGKLLSERHAKTGQPLEYNVEDDEEQHIVDREQQMSASVYMRTLDSSGQ